MFARIGGICLVFALLFVMSSCQPGEEESKHNDLFPLLFLFRNGALPIATPSVCVLSMLSLGAVYFFSQHLK